MKGETHGKPYVLLSVPGDSKGHRMYYERCLRQAPETAGLQDLLVYVTKGLSAVTTQLRAEGKEVSEQVNHLVFAQPIHNYHK